MFNIMMTVIVALTPAQLTNAQDCKDAGGIIYDTTDSTCMIVVKWTKNDTSWDENTWYTDEDIDAMQEVSY